MPIENPLPAFSAWFTDAALQWLAVIGVLVVVAVAFGYLVVALRYGPAEAMRITGRVLKDAIPDLFSMSPRRLWALAWLAVKESIRRRVVVVFGIFIVILLFAGWFLDTRTNDPARLYLTFVLTATSYLVLLLSLFLSAFSLPADIRSRTLHTIVTKPVRASEIVLGRLLGFVIVGTVLVAVMSAISYVFVLRGLSHSHEVTAASLRPAAASSAGTNAKSLTGTTETAQGHSHRFTIDPDGTPRVDMENGHWHDVAVEQSANGPIYSLGGPEGMLQARVPVYGALRFCDPNGMDTEKGINVGDEWMYRSFIQGGTNAAAIWTFKDVTPERFPEGLPIEMNIEVFRTFKGEIEKGVLGSLALRNPRTGLMVEVEIYHAKDFVISRVLVPPTIAKRAGAQVVSRKIQTPEGVELSPPRNALDESLSRKKQFDLFQDLVADGQVEVWVRCIEPSQYFGASQPDLYLRAADASFALNFFKGYLGIWMQMVLVMSFGVMFSTFLSGPVAMIATLGMLVGGFFSDFVAKLARGQVLGGGPFEAIVRLVNQDNLTNELDPGLKTQIVKVADTGAEGFLRVISAILPPFPDFSFGDWVAYGFDIGWDPYIAIPFLRMLAVTIPVFVAGYFLLKTREVAR